MLKLGLTGGIGSGKSSVAAMYRETGYPFYDADQVAKELIASNKPLIREISAAFGEDIYENGKLNRTRLAERAFINSQQQTVLNGLVHPAVERFFTEEFIQLEIEEQPVVLVEASLLFEAATAHRYDKIIVVTADDKLRVLRALTRGNLSENDIRARMKLQLPESEKIKRADFVIHNNGSLDDLRLQWVRLWQELITENHLSKS